MWALSTCDQPNEIKKNAHPKDVTALDGGKVWVLLPVGDEARARLVPRLDHHRTAGIVAPPVLYSHTPMGTPMQVVVRETFVWETGVACKKGYPNIKGCLPFYVSLRGVVDRADARGRVCRRGLVILPHVRPPSLLPCKPAK